MTRRDRSAKKAAPETLGKGRYSLSSHLESYFRVRLKLNTFLPVVMLYRSVRNITVSALVNSAFVPEYCGKRKGGERERER